MKTDVEGSFNSSLPEEFFSNLIDSDKIADQWFLIRTPFPVLGIISLYLLVVLKWGPRYMQDRSPYDLTFIMRVYNLLQVIGNLRLIMYPLVFYVTSLPYIMRLSCRLPSQSDPLVDELKTAFLHLLHGYLVLKIFDLLDTVFMVLRKKFSHITFLHVYHHAVMVFCSWLTIKYIKSTQAAFPGMINVFVHIVMYSYYFLSTFESARQYLWWKKYLTKLQLSQFAVVFLYIFLLFYNDCPISKVFTYIWLFNVFMFFCLFVNFYVKAYVLQPPSTEKEKIS